MVNIQPNTKASKLITTALLALVASASIACFVGCNARPDVPKEKWYGKPTRFIDVNPDNKEEAKVIIAYAESRRRYYRALVSLLNYYKSIGDVQKSQWAETELKNLNETQKFAWRGIEVPPSKVSANRPQLSERLLVENVVDARADYLDKLDLVAQYYEKNNEEFKAYIIHTTQQRFHPEETFMYLRKATLPPMDLSPSEVIPKANAMYDRALELYREGSKIPAMADYNKERQALELFLQMIDKYPKSTRIALAAFYIAEIYKEYFREHYLAVQWYQRAMAWDPRVAAPVRFQCAVQYDFNLGQKRKALSLYKAALKLEPYYPSHVKFCADRIKELEKQLIKSPEPVKQETQPKQAEPK